MAPLRRALAFFRPYRSITVVIVTLTITIGAMNATEPFVLKSVFDALLARRRSILMVSVALLLALVLLREVASALACWQTWRTRLRLHRALLEATMSRLHLLPASSHSELGVAAVTNRLDRSIHSLGLAMNDIVMHLCPSVMYIAIASTIMIRLQAELALLVLAFTILPAALSALAAPVQSRRERHLVDRWARIHGRFAEVLGGIATVQSFGQEERERRRLLYEVSGASRVMVRGVGFDAGVGAAQNLTVAVARVAAVGVGGWMVFHGRISTGSLVAFLGYVGGLVGPVQGLALAYRTLSVAAQALSVVYAILDSDQHIRDAPNARVLTRVRGAVCFEGVSFRYQRAKLPTLEDIELQVKPGEQVAIVGPSGAGKSTLLALLQRLYDPDAGVVRIDGYDLRSLSKYSVRSHIGMVLQDPLLFNETVRDNIAYGRPNASPAEIEAAAQIANASGFIAALPEGYQTVVGEGGSRLSLGERQRLAIARAVLKDPAILVLDEATSALDAETEALVRAALERLIRGRTVFMVAHRLATVVNSHSILVLRNGHIVERGSHRELLAANRYYAQMVRQQVAGLIDAAA
jgi:ATP-binding cassette subfamily B protein